MVPTALTHTDAGSGRVVILIHGFPLTQQMWNAQINAFSPAYRIITPDLRGFGQSPLGTAPFTMESCADDIYDLLASKSIEQHVVLVGLSMGGYICFEFVRKYQHLLDGLILVATQPSADNEPARNSRREMAEFVLQEGPKALAARLTPRLLGRTTIEKKPHVAKTVCRLVESNCSEGIAKACFGLAARRDSTSVLPRIQVPTLIMAGSEDVLIPIAQSRAMQERIPNSQIVVVEQCGHLINLEQSAVFEQTVSQFLATFK